MDAEEQWKCYSLQAKSEITFEVMLVPCFGRIALFGGNVERKCMLEIAEEPKLSRDLSADPNAPCDIYRASGVFLKR